MVANCSNHYTLNSLALFVVRYSTFLCIFNISVSSLHFAHTIVQVGHTDAPYNTFSSCAAFSRHSSTLSCTIDTQLHNLHTIYTHFSFEQSTLRCIVNTQLHNQHTFYTHSDAQQSTLFHSMVHIQQSFNTVIHSTVIHSTFNTDTLFIVNSTLHAQAFTTVLKIDRNITLEALRVTRWQALTNQV